MIKRKSPRNLLSHQEAKRLFQKLLPGDKREEVEERKDGGLENPYFVDAEVVS